jgi:hypothetical protein
MTKLAMDFFTSIQAWIDKHHPDLSP